MTAPLAHKQFQTQGGEPIRDEFVPDEELRETLRWDERHDAVARLIINEFDLILPRDRELVQQLAFLRVEQGAAHFLPFGRHKGQLIEQISDADPSYLEWLVRQDWFVAQFPTLHEAIVKLDAEETSDEQTRATPHPEPVSQCETEIEVMTWLEVQTRLRAVTGNPGVDAQYKQRLWRRLDELEEIPF
jgi:hypothetical protein